MTSQWRDRLHLCIAHALSCFGSFSLRIDVPPAVAPAAKTAPIVLITNNGDDVTLQPSTCNNGGGNLSPSMQVIREIEQGRPTSLPKRAVSPIHAALLRHAEEQDGDVTEAPPASPRHLKVAPVSPTQRSVSPTLLAVMREEEAQKKQHGGASDYAPAAMTSRQQSIESEHNNYNDDSQHKLPHLNDDVTVSKQSRSFRMLQAEVGRDDVTAPSVFASNNGASRVHVYTLRLLIRSLRN